MTKETKTFPIPDDKVALFDLDGTLLGQDYQFTDDAIYSAVQTAQESGWHVGLSSDTPYEALALWRQQLHLNGPIIAERGAITETQEGLLYNGSEPAIYHTAAIQICRNWQDMGANVWHGNPVKAIRNNVNIGKPGETVVLVNAMRKCSLSFHIRQVEEDGSLAISQPLTEAMANAARSFYPPFDDLEEDLNHDYGLIIISRESVNKRTGAQRLASVLQIGKFAMVGNSMSDYLGDDIAVHYAVADASDAYKAAADYIANFPQTGGAVEILQKMAESA